MSCDDNHEARANDRVRRSLPVVGSAAASARRPPADRPPRASSGGPSTSDRARSTPGAANEFPGGAAELEGTSRRGFMQLLGVSTAVATVGAACRKPNEKIIPFVRRPEELTPGNPLHFATGYALEGFTSGLLVESHEGHPTKVEGNPAHPETLGATTAAEQALILGLYDDDRAKQLRRGGTPIAWPTFLSELKARSASLAGNGGAGLRFLTGPTASPLLADLRRRILERFPRAKFVSYSSVAADGAIEGAKLAFGRPLMPRHHLGAAAVILSLDADFLNDGPEQTRLSREFSARREPSRDMNRLYVVEPAITVTGAMADHRLRLRGGDIAAFAAGLCAMLSGRGLSALGPVGSLGHGAGLWDSKWLVALAADLEKNRGRSLVIAGRRQPAVVHALAARDQQRAGQRRRHRRVRRADHHRCHRGRRAAARAGRRDRRRGGRHAGGDRREPGLRRAGRLQAGAAPEARPERHLSQPLRGRDGAELQLPGSRRAPARVVGRRARHRRRRLDRSAARRAALGREDRGRGALCLRRRRRARNARAPPEVLEQHVEASRQSGRIVRRRLGALAGRRHRPRHRRQLRAGAGDQRAGAGPGGRAVAGSQAPGRPDQAPWSSPSRPTPRSSTVASPTTPGCRSCRTRSSS